MAAQQDVGVIWAAKSYAPETRPRDDDAPPPKIASAETNGDRRRPAPETITSPPGRSSHEVPQPVKSDPAAFLPLCNFSLFPSLTSGQLTAARDCTTPHIVVLYYYSIMIWSRPSYLVFDFHRYLYLKMLYFVIVVAISSLHSASAASIGAGKESVSVHCEKDSIKVTVYFDHINFFGIVYTRPYRGSCNVLGSGDDSVTLVVPLKSPGREDCGVIKYDTFDTIVVDVRSHHAVEMITDRSFLVQCSSTKESTVLPSPTPHITAALQLLKNDAAIDRTVVGDSYTVELHVPDGLRYTATSCLAFSAADDIQLALLIDRKGCPVGDVMTPFYPLLDGSGRVRAEMVMFDFNNSHYFHIQCNVIRCVDLCKMPSCPDQSRSIGYTQLLSHKEAGSTVTATRVSVLQQQHKLEEQNQIIEECQVSPGSSTTALSILLAILIVLTGTSCLSAWYNRPFRCQFNVAPMDTPYSFKHDFLRIVEEQITPPGTPIFSFPSPSVVQEAFRSTISTLSGRRSKRAAVTICQSPSALATSEYQNIRTIPSDSDAATNEDHSRSCTLSAKEAKGSEILVVLNDVKPTISNEPADSSTTVQQRKKKKKPIPPPRKQSLKNSFKDDNFSCLPSPPSAKSYIDTSDYFPPPPSRLETIAPEKTDAQLSSLTNNHVKFDQQLTVYTEGLDEDDIERARSMASTYMTLNNRMTAKSTTTTAFSADCNDTIPREYPLMGVSALVNEPHKNVYWFYDV